MMAAHRHGHGTERGAGMTTWPDALAEKLKQLEAKGADKALAAQARAQIKQGNLVEAEETLGHLELYLCAWMKQ
jgi:hypothetical protein